MADRRLRGAGGRRRVRVGAGARRRRGAVPAALAAWVLAASVAGCGEDVTGLSVDDTRNHFTWQAQLHGVDGRDAWPWVVSGDAVWVDWSGTRLESGAVRLVLTDAEGAVVYAQRAGPEPPAPAATLSGAAGEWTVTLEYEAARGAGAIDLLVRR